MVTEGDVCGPVQLCAHTIHIWHMWFAFQPIIFNIYAFAQVSSLMVEVNIGGQTTTIRLSKLSLILRECM